MRCLPQSSPHNPTEPHQLVILSRAVKRPRLTAADRALLVRLASRLRAWAGALVIVRPETVLRWHREGFRLCWQRKSARRSATARIPVETVTLIRRLAAENRLWGAARIHGELLKVQVRVRKRTIQQYLGAARSPATGPVLGDIAAQSRQ